MRGEEGGRTGEDGGREGEEVGGKSGERGGRGEGGGLSIVGKDSDEELISCGDSGEDRGNKELRRCGRGREVTNLVGDGDGQHGVTRGMEEKRGEGVLQQQ